MKKTTLAIAIILNTQRRIYLTLPPIAMDSESMNHLYKERQFLYIQAFLCIEYSEILSKESIFVKEI